MDVLVADLYEAGPGFRQQVPGDEKPVTQVRQVGMNTELPRVAEGLDLLGLARRILELAVLDVTLAGGDLPVGAELDPVWRVEVDHLDLAAQLLAFGE